MEKVKVFYKQWEHLAGPLFFISGFIFDIMTLGRVDETLNFSIFFIYLLISFFFFCVDFGMIKTSFPAGSWQQKVLNYQDEIFHFCQGALLSAFTLFYFKSASGLYSLLFMGLLVGVLFINEVQLIKKQGVLIKSIFFNLTLMSFLLVYIPLPFGKVGLVVFTTALSLYLLVAFGIAKLFQRAKIEREQIKKIWIIPAISFFVIFLFLRIFKLIPPVPLSIETAGIYHNIEKKYPAYHLYHQRKWWRIWDSSDEHFLYKPGDKVYFFTRIFAPRGFEDKVYVKWMKYTSSGWQQSDRIPLSIIGGRGKGFRGYTYKSYVTPGEWRVLVETSGGLEIGRLSFEIFEDKQEYRDTSSEEVAKDSPSEDQPNEAAPLKERVFIEVIDK
jgi:hypothetical protein